MDRLNKLFSMGHRVEGQGGSQVGRAQNDSSRRTDQEEPGAQRYQLSDSVEVFGEGVYEMLRATNDSSAVQVGRQFSGMWYTEKLSAAQKDSI